MIARNLAVPKLEPLADLLNKKIVVPGQRRAGRLLIDAESGKLRERLSTPFKDGTEVAAALLRGDVMAAAGQASELEPVLAGDARCVIEPLPVPRMRAGWAVGMAVKKEREGLAFALQAAVNPLMENGELGRLFAVGKVGWRKP